MSVLSESQWNEMLELAKKCAYEGDIRGMNAAALLLRHGRLANENNLEEALPFYQMAADHGDAESAEMTGIIYLNKDKPCYNEELGFEYMKQAADAGRPHAQYVVGMAYFLELGVKKDVDAAIAYLEKAAIQNNADAQMELFDLILSTCASDNPEQPLIDAGKKLRASHWLTCAYLNGNEEAIKRVSLRPDFATGSIFKANAASIKKNGPDPEKQDENIRKLFEYEPGKTFKKTDDPAEHAQKDKDNDKETSSEGCYIATAVYGSYDCPQVWTLRRFRDNILAGNVFGRLFISIYYAISPTLVRLFGKQNWFRNFWKIRLDKLVTKLNDQGVDDTPYSDRPRS